MDMLRTAALIPEAALKKHIAILGTNGSGKTSVAKSQVVEPALAAGERVCCVDPTGVMWGVRLGADGKPKGGYPVYIVGGEHADFPLTKRDGDAWAEIVGTSSDSFIFDTSLMTVSDRTAWFTDFAQTLIRKNKGPLRLVLDEAHLFAPQGGATSGGQAPAMLHSANNLLALGRSKGLRVTMISQRPAKLHKDSLSQAHTLIAMKLIAPQDRKAISEWVSDQTDPDNGKDLIASLPSLVPGEGWVWAPAEGVLERVRFPRPRTYDSSQAPDDGDAAAPVLVRIDPATISGRLATVAAEADANDPVKLKRRIAELERAKPVPMPAGDPKSIQAAEQRGYERGRGEGLTEGAEAARAMLVKQITDALVIKEPLIFATAKPHSGAPRIAPAAVQRQAPVVRTPVEGDVAISNPQATILKSLAWWKHMGHTAPLRSQIAAICGWKAASSHLKNRLSELSTKGLVVYPSLNRVSMTEAGAAVAPEPDIGMTVVSGVRSALTNPQAAIFDVLLPNGQATISRDDIADALGWDRGSSHLKNRLSELSTLQVVTYPSKGSVALADWLFAA